jgi:hypothetical protein
MDAAGAGALPHQCAKTTGNSIFGDLAETQLTFGPERAALSPPAAREHVAKLHAELDAHFTSLRAHRDGTDSEAPIFALEHGLNKEALRLLRYCVRTVVASGSLRNISNQHWLPLAVYAAEAGYSYAGNEYWTTFARETPGWREYGDREDVGHWLRRFSDRFRGARPRGGFAGQFRIIAWPTTHAVLPMDLQRAFAELLFDFRMAINADLLADPDEFGEILAGRARNQNERFRNFAENTSLLGQIASQLLSGDEAESHYLYRDTLNRLIASIGEKRRTREWLDETRRTVHRNLRGLQQTRRHGARQITTGQLPPPREARLILRGGVSGWRLFAQLPNLGELSERLPDIHEEVRTKRALIEGSETYLAHGRLNRSGQEIELVRWPDGTASFIHLEGGSSPALEVIRDLVTISRGPIRLFKVQAGGVAIEIRNLALRPGSTYVLVGRSMSAKQLPFCERTATSFGVPALRLRLPASLPGPDVDAFRAAGLAVSSDVDVRPVGLPASNWDGQGAVEWLVGEPGLIGIWSHLEPSALTIEHAGQTLEHAWPAGSTEAVVRISEIPVGEHTLHVRLSDGETDIADGALAINVSAPRSRADGAESGEGIRLYSSPSRPLVDQLWADGAITIAGPPDSAVDFRIELFDDSDSLITQFRRNVVLPMSEADWGRIAEKVRSPSAFARHLDNAEAVILTASKAGVGFATLRADRGFRPLSWRLHHARDEYSVRLVDHTDSPDVFGHLHRYERPLSPEAVDTKTALAVPATGGLVRASAGKALEATLVLPSMPTSFLQSDLLLPQLPLGNRSPSEALRLVEGYRLWESAELPTSPFARRNRNEVLRSISAAVASLLADDQRWTRLEQGLLYIAPADAQATPMLQIVANTTWLKSEAEQIAQRGPQWADPNALIGGFAEIMREQLIRSGFGGYASAPKFLLTLAGRCSRIHEWRPPEREHLLRQVLRRPQLFRAARAAYVATLPRHGEAQWRDF